MEHERTYREGFARYLSHDEILNALEHTATHAHSQYHLSTPDEYYNSVLLHRTPRQ